MSPLITRFTWGLILFQMFFWTLVPLVSHHAPPLDATEMYGWSLSFEWGFYKHPPMPPWIVAVMQGIVGKNMLSLFLCASLAISATYYAVAWLASQFLEEKEAIVALFLYALTIYCHLWSTDFNHNQIQMTFWAWSLLFLHKTLQAKSVSLAFVLGVMMGLNALSKYTAAFIVPCALMLLIFSKQWREQVNLKIFVVATLGFLLVFGPHLWWLTQHDFMPFRYVSERFEELDQSKSNFLSLLDYVGNTFIAHLFLWIAAVFCYVKFKPQDLGLLTPKVIEQQTLRNKQFLIYLGLGPFLLSCVIGICVPLYYRWSTPMLPMLTIVLAFLLRGRLSHLFKKKYLISFILIQVVFGIVYVGKASFNKNSNRGNYPAPEIAQMVHTNWQNLYPSSPLRIVAGGEWEAGFISLFNEGKIFVFTQADYQLAPWVHPDMVKNCGMVMISPSQKELNQFPDAKVQSPIIIPANSLYQAVTITWASLAPQGKCD
ncbi:glycosyltransferase family 39 protein [Polynucleobacter rarus]|uniref:glycosyltransferase family 39 protein n=1 Tax=Polynucleobacter rarus TaxID=556055 RepID=UPI00131F07C7|nr:glycosyltransferase family 39 protein [Polynucleobacter rarus]